MSKVIYEVTLSPDDNHSVSVKSDDPLSLKDALPLAKQIQEWVSGADRAKVSPPAQRPSAQPHDLEQPQGPLCGIHSIPMAKVQGSRGPFWSCHQRAEDGSWCSYRPPRGSSTPPAYSFPTI